MEERKGGLEDNAYTEHIAYIFVYECVSACVRTCCVQYALIYLSIYDFFSSSRFYILIFHAGFIG